MIILYRQPDDQWADEIQEALDEMVIAYETDVFATASAGPDDVPALPALRDDGEIVTEETALRKRLDKLRRLMQDWDRFQSDACYLEDDGSVC